ncbi:MAG: hypothetical protein RPS47_09690 [Colwellia sp.]
MIQAILGIIIFFIALGLIIKLSKIAWKAVLWILGLAVLILIAPMSLAGYFVLGVLRVLRLEKLGIFAVSIVGVSFPFAVAYLYGNNFYDVLNFEFGKYFLTLPLFLLCIPALRKLRLSEKQVYSSELLSDKRKTIYNLYFIALSFNIFTAFDWVSLILESGYDLQSNFLIEHSSWFIVGYWLCGALSALWGYLLAAEIKNVTNKTCLLLSKVERVNRIEIEKEIIDLGSFLDDAEVKDLFNNILLMHITNGLITEVELADENIMLYETSLYEESLQKIGQECINTDRMALEDLSGLVSDYLSLSGRNATYFAETNVDNGSFHQFRDGKYFVSYISNEVRICACCGTTELEQAPLNGEWFCSDLCINTEELCVNIKEQEAKDFINNSVTTGVILMAGSDAWVENHKLFAIGGQGHGFAAENANNIIDKLKGKDAAVIGGDNAKNGADRLVDGQLIQTKYCATGARSVGAAFDGQGGDYKYLTEGGEPMALEVPKDQYFKAVETMENKIRDGKVPGITDPSEAQKLVVKGSVTYEQARNITRFGTVESVSYDIAEGAVVGLSAAGISFGITVATCFLQDKDKSVALKAGLVQGVKAFGKTTTVFVGVQQLHRLEVVQSALKNIDIQHLSPSLKSFVQQGTSTKSVSGANTALRGTVLTTVVVIAVTTGPDILKLVRGRISSGQFVKNLAVISTGAVGGVAGSFAGGALLSPFGPAGMIAGRIVGGMVGSAVSTLAAKHIANKLVEDDRDMIMDIIIQQVEHQVSIFMLTVEEIDNLNQNLQKVISDEVVERIFASKDERVAAANFVVKPIIIAIVKQRLAISYSLEDISKEGKKLERSFKYLKAA